MGFRLPKIKVKMPKINVPNPIDKTRELAERAANEAREAAQRAEQEARQQADRVRQEAQQQAERVNNTVNNLRNVALGAAQTAIVEATKNAMSSAKVADVAMNEIEAGAKIAGKAMEQGAYKVAEGGELIAEWAQANYCQIGVSIALGTIFAALLYRPEPASQATTVAATAPLTSTAVLYLAAKETVGAVALGTACYLTASAFVELIWMSSDIRKAIGNSNKKLLTAGIAFSLAKSIDVAAGAMIVPQSCAAVVAGVVTSLVAQLACERTLPNGAREWAITGASGL